MKYRTMSEALVIPWLRLKQVEKPHPYTAKGDPGHIKPMWADHFGTNYSCVIDGLRFFCFESERARDLFCKTYRAEPCELPECVTSMQIKDALHATRELPQRAAKRTS